MKMAVQQRPEGANHVALQGWGFREKERAGAKALEQAGAWST